MAPSEPNSPTSPKGGKDKKDKDKDKKSKKSRKDKKDKDKDKAEAEAAAPPVPAQTSAGAVLAGQRQSYEMRVATRAATVDAIEERLAIGLEPVDVGSALLLGRCCRALSGQDVDASVQSSSLCEPGEEASADVSETALESLVEDKRAEGEPPPEVHTTKIIASEIDALPPLPAILADAKGGGLAPVPHEYARLEGYRWMHNKARGKGTTYSVERFGTRGECVLCPAFCTVKPPDTEPFLEAEAGGTRWSADYLDRALHQLCERIRGAKKVAPEAYIDVVDAAPSIVLVVSAGKLVIKDQPSCMDFSRKAARRHPLYLDAVEMGARLSISVVPCAETPSGDLDKVDADLLVRQLGAQLFPFAGQNARLCFRRRGGPPLDSRRVAGKSISNICAYISTGWADTLGAMPTTWVRLSVSAARSSHLESLVGPPPGRGLFAHVNPRNKAPRPPCSYCGALKIVGYEVLSKPEHNRHGKIVARAEVLPDGSTRLPLLRALCSTCSAFVRGSPAFKQKQRLTEYVSRGADETIGTANEGLDEALGDETGIVEEEDPSEPTTPEAPKGKAGKASQAAKAAKGSQAKQEDPASAAAAQIEAAKAAEAEYEASKLQRLGWEDNSLPLGAAILAVSGTLSLACPPEGFDRDERNCHAALERELCGILGCKLMTARITSMLPELDIGGFALGILILHPATAEPNSSAVLALKQDTSSEDLGPQAPLLMYRRLAEYMLSTLTKEIEQSKNLVASSASRAISPSSIVFCPQAELQRAPFKASNLDVDDIPNFDSVSVYSDAPVYSDMEDEDEGAGFSLFGHKVGEQRDDGFANVVRQASQNLGNLTLKLKSAAAASDKPQVASAGEHSTPQSPASPAGNSAAGSATAHAATVDDGSSGLPASVDGASASAAAGAASASISPTVPTWQTLPTVRSPTPNPEDTTAALLVAAASAAADGNPLAAVLWSFGPTQFQLALRLRELAAAHLAPRCHRLLTRWGGADMDGGATSALAVVSRNAQRFGGQSALDLAIVSGDRPTMDALLDHVPEFDSFVLAPSLGPAQTEVPAEPAPGEEATVSTEPAPGEKPAAPAEQAPGEKPASPARPPPVEQPAVPAEPPQVEQPAVAAEPAQGGEKEASSAEAAPGEKPSVPAEAASGEEPAGVEEGAALTASGEAVEGDSIEVPGENTDEAPVSGHPYESRDDVAALLNTPNPATGYTPIYAVCLYPSEHTLGFVNRLVRRRADPNLCGVPSSVLQGHGATQPSGQQPESAVVRHKETPILPATRRGEQHLVHKLLELRGDANDRSSDGSSLLQVAVERGCRKTLAVILSATNIEINALDPKGRNALVTALRCNCVDLAADLRHASCNVCQLDQNGAPPLLHAITVHDGDLCQLLLEKRADKNAKDPADNSHVLHLAAHTRNLPFFHALLAARADIHARHPAEGRTALHYVSALRMESPLRALLDLAAEVDARSAVGDTPLRVAVVARDMEAVDILCNARADPNASNGAGCAPIHAAVAVGDTSIMQLLVEHRADVHLADSRRWSPMHYGASGGNGDVVEMLLKSGADPYAKSFHGRTPRDVGVGGAAAALVRAATMNPPPPGWSAPVPPKVPRLIAVRRPPEKPGAKQKPFVHPRWQQQQATTRSRQASKTEQTSSSSKDGAEHAEASTPFNKSRVRANSEFTPNQSVQEKSTVLSEPMSPLAGPQLSIASWDGEMSATLPPLGGVSRRSVTLGTPRRAKLKEDDVRLRLLGTSVGSDMSPPNRRITH